MSDYRFRHTAGVADMVGRLAALYCPEKAELLQAAALLHDVTKELPENEQRRIMAANGIDLRSDEDASPKIFHGITAALLIPERYPEWASAELISAVRWHTTGRAEMSVPEKLLYLADYIDQSRTFEKCVRLRRFFWDARPEDMKEDERLALLRETLILSYRFTIEDLIAEGRPVAIDTIEARNRLLLEKAREA
jgi:nicotinate-nucleotide adenylyltransferase